VIERIDRRPAALPGICMTMFAQNFLWENEEAILVAKE